MSTFFLLANLEPETSGFTSSCCEAGVALLGWRQVLVGDGGRPRTSASVVLKGQTVPQEQTGSRFALGPALFSDGAHTEVRSVEVLEKPLMWSRAFRNQWR